MKALILAAGRGTRMSPITKYIPKPMIEIKGRPFISYIVDALHEAGINDIHIIVGHLGDQIVQYFSEKGEKINFIAQEETLGTGHAVLKAEEAMGNDEFLVLMGDNLYSPKDLLKFKKEDEFIYVGGFRVKNPEKYGVLLVENGFLKKIVEKPKEPETNLINVGLYKFTSEIFEILEKVQPSERGEIELTDAVNMLAEKNKVKVIEIEDYWIDLGSVEQIPEVEKQIKELGL